MTRKPIDRMIDDAVTCSKCGTQGFMKCDCWTACECGWYYATGGECRNPEHEEADQNR